MTEHQIDLAAVQDGDIVAVGNQWLRGRAVLLAREFAPSAWDLQDFAEYTWSAGLGLDQAKAILEAATLLDGPSLAPAVALQLARTVMVRAIEKVLIDGDPIVGPAPRGILTGPSEPWPPVGTHFAIGRNGDVWQVWQASADPPYSWGLSRRLRAAKRWGKGTK